MSDPPEWFIKGLIDTGQKVEDEYNKELNRMFAGNDAPDACANLVRQLNACDKVESTTGTIGGPDRSADLLAKMTKMIRDMNKNTPPGNVAERIDMGKDALAELRRQTPTVQASPDDSFALGGIRIFLAPLLDDDQWIAYDRHGIPLAFGRTSSVKILVPREPT